MDAAMPLVEELYRVKAGSENRAIAGLSMGGLHSLTIGLSHLNQFDWIGAFSAAVPEPEDAAKMLADPNSVNKNLKLLWIACGKKDFLLKENQRFVGELEAAGIKHRWLLTEGSHAWPVWRGYLADFVPLLFQ
jgi:enterochelin esterase family protein